MTIDALKAEARKAAFAARSGAFAAGQGRAADLLADYLAAYKGSALSGYMPMRTEIDPLPAMAAHQGPVCVPVIMGKGQPLRFREWTPGCAMVPGEFGERVQALYDARTLRPAAADARGVGDDGALATVERSLAGGAQSGG